MDKRDEIQFECPRCGVEVAPPPDEPNRTWATCHRCGEVLNLASQRALFRAEANFDFAQELTTPELMDIRNRPNELSPQAKDALRSYQKSYTGIQLALQARLPAEQRETAIAMMVEIARILQRHQMISALEARYWAQLMVVQTARQEYQTLQAKLREPHPTLWTRLFRHPHWRLRRSQLKHALQRRNARLQELEQSMAFVNTLYVQPEKSEV
ncbi:MAG: hypothetical protein ACP5HG_09095 [Anaerolineae bacterium]